MTIQVIRSHNKKKNNKIIQQKINLIDRKINKIIIIVKEKMQHQISLIQDQTHILQTVNLKFKRRNK